VVGPRPDALEITAACDGFVLSSHNESFCKSLVEAMCLGVPTVSTDIPGHHGVVEDGVTGRVVPVRDPEALGLALADLASDRDRARAWGVSGRERIRTRWSHQRSVEGMLGLVGRLAGR
jgi:glycosyltransferase involved in cell wall biosynthesis